MESLGKALPGILFPYLQQWAERSGLTLLSQLLVDEQFRGLFEKYGDAMLTLMAQGSYATGTGNGQVNGKEPAPRANPRVGEADANSSDLSDLQDRVLAREAQQALLELLRSKIRPLALALGCCPECLVGAAGCPKCWGQSKVGLYPPDYMLLEAEVVSPLAALGVPLVLNEREVPSAMESKQ
jgi:hypothetical protein